jgi:hypothetical protein
VQINRASGRGAGGPGPAARRIGVAARRFGEEEFAEEKVDEERDDGAVVAQRPITAIASSA